MVLLSSWASSLTPQRRSIAWNFAHGFRNKSAAGESTFFLQDPPFLPHVTEGGTHEYAKRLAFLWHGWLSRMLMSRMFRFTALALNRKISNEESN